MVFTTAWRDSPILFSTWAPSGVGSHVGSIFAIIFMAMLLRIMTIICQQMTPGFRKASMVTLTMGLGYLVMLISMTYIIVSILWVGVGGRGRGGGDDADGKTGVFLCDIDWDFCGGMGEFGGGVSEEDEDADRDGGEGEGGVFMSLILSKRMGRVAGEAAVVTRGEVGQDDDETGCKCD